MVEILDINDERVAEFRSIRDSNIESKGLLIAESEKVVLKLLASDLEVKKLFITREFYDRNEINLSEDKIFFADKKVMEQIVGHKLHHGIMASASRPKNYQLDELDEKILILNGLSSPENVGTIIRTAAGFNIRSVIIDHKTVTPYLRRCIRVSMGNIFRMKVHEAHDLLETLKTLQEKDYRIVGTANEPGSVDIKDTDFSGKCAVITGSEGHGMDREIIDQCDVKSFIPMDETVAHFNAACATAIYLYHFSDSN